jgi:predicted nucleotidyltransferase
MAMTLLPPDFKDFLRLLNSHRVEYLLVGGYAVGYHGYPRATADMDLWTAMTAANAQKVTAALREFGFESPELRPGLFLEKEKVIRMGLPPVRIEILTTLSGVDFDGCYSRREIIDLDGVEVNLISLDDLKKNKQAAGRHQDLNDLEHLP